MVKKYIYITNPIYPFTFHVFLGYNNHADILKRLHTDNPHETEKIHKQVRKINFNKIHGCTIDKFGWVIIIVKDLSYTPEFYDTLHHEIVHAVDFSASIIGLKQPKRIKEYSAYMHGFITREIYKVIHKK